MRVKEDLSGGGGGGRDSRSRSQSRSRSRYPSRSASGMGWTAGSRIPSTPSTTTRILLDFHTMVTHSLFLGRNIVCASQGRFEWRWRGWTGFPIPQSIPFWKQILLKICFGNGINCGIRNPVHPLRHHSNPSSLNHDGKSIFIPREKHHMCESRRI